MSVRHRESFFVGAVVVEMLFTLRTCL